MSEYKEKRNQHADKISELLLQNMRDNAVMPLSSEQEQALKDAAQQVLKQRTHRFQSKGVVPLYFFTFYYVFWMGIDRRDNAEAITMKRRYGTSLLKSMFFLAFIVLCMLAVSFFSPFLSRLTW